MRDASLERWEKVTHISVGFAWVVAALFGLFGYATFTALSQGMTHFYWIKKIIIIVLWQIGKCSICCRWFARKLLLGWWHDEFLSCAILRIDFINLSYWMLCISWSKPISSIKTHIMFVQWMRNKSACHMLIYRLWEIKFIDTKQKDQSNATRNWILPKSMAKILIGIQRISHWLLYWPHLFYHHWPNVWAQCWNWM